MSGREILSSSGRRARTQEPHMTKSCSSITLTHHHTHHHHHLKSEEKENMPEELEKENSPTFDGDVKKDEDVEAWLLVMNNFFRIHYYSDNMKSIIASYILKGKDDI